MNELSEVNVYDRKILRPDLGYRLTESPTSSFPKWVEFAKLLTGRENPVRRIKTVNTSNGEVLAIEPNQDRNLVLEDGILRIKDQGDGDAPPESGLKNKLMSGLFGKSTEEKHIMGGSLLNVFDSVRLVSATEAAMKEMIGKVPDAVPVWNHGNLVGVVAPMMLQETVRLKNKKKSWWNFGSGKLASEPVNPYQGKGMSGWLLAVDEAFIAKPDNFGLLVQQITALCSKEAGAELVEDVVLKFKMASIEISYYNTVIQQLSTQDFGQGHPITDYQLSQMKTMLGELNQQMMSLNTFIIGLSHNLPQKEQDRLHSLINNPGMIREVKDTFMQFGQEALVNRLLRLGVNPEFFSSCEGLSLDPEIVVEMITERRLDELRKPSRNLAKKWDRYIKSITHTLFDPNSRYFQSIDQLKARLTPEWQVFEALAGRAMDAFLTYLDIPDSEKKRLKSLVGEGKSGGLVELPRSIKEWLDQEPLTQKLADARSALAEHLSVQNEWDESKKIEYQLLKQRWETQLNQIQKNIPAHNDNVYPIRGFNISMKKDSLNGLTGDPQLIAFLDAEIRLREEVAVKEYAMVNKILDMQRKGNGYDGWIKDNPFASINEASPARIMIDERMNCIGREGLVLSALKYLNFDIYSANTNNHGFLMIEDNLGFGRVVDPSSTRSGSFFIDQELHFLDQSCTVDDGFLMEMDIPGLGIYMVEVFKGDYGWVGGVLKNWLINMFDKDDSKTHILLRQLSTVFKEASFTHMLKRIYNSSIQKNDGKLLEVSLKCLNKDPYFFLAMKDLNDYYNYIASDLKTRNIAENQISNFIAQYFIQGGLKLNELKDLKSKLSSYISSAAIPNHKNSSKITQVIQSRAYDNNIFANMDPEALKKIFGYYDESNQLITKGCVLGYYLDAIEYAIGQLSVQTND